MTEPDRLYFANHMFSAADLLTILEVITDGITVQDSTGRLIYANPVAAHLAGFETAEEMIRTPPRDILRGFSVYDEFGEPLRPKDLPGRRALAGNTEQERLVRIVVVATGEERWSIIKAQPAFDEQGNVRFAVNIWHDVTDRMSRQQLLEQNTAALEEMQTELEATVAELEERTEEAEEARRRAEYVADRQRFLAEAGRLLASSLDYEQTLRLIPHLAVPRIADWCTVNLLDEKGELKQLELAHADPARLRSMRHLQERYPTDDETSLRVMRTGRSELFRDITDDLLVQTARDEEHLRLLREMRLHSAMIVPLKIRDEVLGTISFIAAESGRQYGLDDLEFAESLAARSALSISNARLYREAQEANRAKADFLAVMSHELRTPLTAIFGYTELLSAGITGAVNEKQLGQLERIRSSAHHLLGIIEDILSYARAEAGHDVVRPELVRLSDVVNEAVSLVSTEAQRKHLDLRHSVVEDCVMNTDRVKVRQILVNLVGNAVKFTDSGTVEVTATCPGGSEAVVTVRDTGVGIAEADLERIFEPFQQLQRATTRTAGGTGLGLAVTRRFVDLLGGSIEVRSTPGKGTSFTVTIPLGVAAESMGA